MSQKTDLRRFVYAGLDLGLALLYLVLWSAVPTRHLGGHLLQWSMVGAAVAMGLGLVVAGRWGFWASVIGCAFLLLLELVLLVLLAASAAFLAGVYGAFGEGAALLAVVVAALSIELVALVPALQLKFLLTRAGRRALGAS